MLISLLSMSGRFVVAALFTWRPPTDQKHFPLNCLGLGRFGLLLFALLLMVVAAVPARSAQPPVVIHVGGDLTETQRQNILTHLSLNRLGENETLSATRFSRLCGKARQEAATALQPFGYYSPEIALNEQWRDGTHHVEMVVATGPPVTVAEVVILLTGPGAEDADLLQAVRRFPLREGDILDHQTYEGGKDSLVSAALENGYHRAALGVSRVEIKRKAQSAVVRLQLDTGPRYLFGPLTFAAEFIDHDLLNKIAPVREGDPFSPKALTRLRQSLFNSGYFSTVDLEYDIKRAIDNKVPVKLVLTPDLAHKYGIGLGYGTDTGIRGTLAYRNRYVNRLGHQLDTQLQPSQRKSNLSGVYTIPIGDPRRDRLTIAAKYEDEEFDNTDTKTLSTTISHDHFRERGEYSTYLQFLDERYTTGPNTDEAALVIPGIKGSFFWADDPITTKRGVRFTVTTIGSEESVLADTTFLQASLRTKAIYTLFEQWRCIGRADIGTTLVDDIYSLPPSLRYYTGGDQSVRGYGYKTIGPTDADGNVIGGKNLLIYSAELERTLFDAWSGALFYDSGTAMNSFTNISLHSGAGIGLRWSGVFGQIRLDLAKALDEEGSWRIHFTMGADL